MKKLKSVFLSVLSAMFIYATISPITVSAASFSIIDDGCSIDAVNIGSNVKASGYTRASRSVDQVYVQLDLYSDGAYVGEAYQSRNSTNYVDGRTIYNWAPQYGEYLQLSGYHTATLSGTTVSDWTSDEGGYF